MRTNNSVSREKGAFSALAFVGFLAVFSAALPDRAAADYLYGLSSESGAEPYVLFVADVSGSMYYPDAGCPPGYSLMSKTTTIDHHRLREIKVTKCERGSGKSRSEVFQYTRMEVLQATLKDLIPKMDNINLGISKFGLIEDACITRNCNDNYCKVELSNALPTSSGDSPPTQTALLTTVENMKPDGGTPLGVGLESALAHLKAVKDADGSGHCRPYAVVLLSDGEPDCSSDFGGSEDKGDGTKAKTATVELRKAGIQTYVVGFGNQADKDLLNEMAQKAGTARTASGWCIPDATTGECSGGEALYAENSTELLEVLKTTFQQISRGQYTVMAPMVATVPQEKSEYDRVANNFMAYSAFEIPDHRGRLYGVRLFQEKKDTMGVWEFTDLSSKNEDFDLARCGSERNPCVFEAGSLLQKREEARRIFFAKPKSWDTTDDGLVLTMGESIAFGSNNTRRRSTIFDVASAIIAEDSPLQPGVLALSESDRRVLELLGKSADAEGDALRQKVANWVEGSSRPWKLGDIYHSAPAIVTQPPYSYRGYGYPIYKTNYRNRPSMIYVGANDGQIHAFHASDDHFPVGEDGEEDEKAEPRWKAGEEAWAFVPFNMVAKVSLAAAEGASRVFSQDLSCRVDDVIAHPVVGGDGKVDCSLDPEDEERGTCGWRTVMVCGQGWGGSWYVALDITDPLNPRPMWEATHVGDGEYGLGRTWAVPSVGAVNMEVERDGQKVGVPTWLAIYGSGYNTSHRDHGNNRNASYRYLNMPFAGAYPEHGWGIMGPKGNDKKEKSFVYVQDLLTGKFLRIFDIDKQYGITADIPLVGTKDPFFVDVGYFGGWAGGKLGRLHMPMKDHRTRPDLWGYCDEVLSFSESKPLTARPSVYTDPRDPTKIYAFIGSGLDPGNDPDQQQNQGKMWEFQAFRFEDDGTSECPTKPDTLCGNILKTLFKGEGDRLISPPTLAIQRDHSMWLTFTTWSPGGAKGCGDGTSYLYCFDVSDGEKCPGCFYDEATDKVESQRELGSHKSQTPVVADGQIYVIGDDGTPDRIDNQDGSNTGPTGGGMGGGANQGAPRAMVLSWREIF